MATLASLNPNMKLLVIDTSELDFVNHPSDYESIKKLIFEVEYPDGVNMLIL